ncbi:MAG: RHS repeat protein, partial [Blastocatellia bacterium]|nr:RHS repeat protein [Blastocatellia bacterium]
MKLISELFDLSPEMIYNGDHYVYPGGFTALWLPDGRSYQFRYNVYGQLARVVLPTGGAVEYDWANPNLGLGWGTRNRVTEKRVYNSDSVLVNKTVFSVVQGPPNEVVAVEHFDAVGTRLTKSNHYFHGAPDNGLGSIVSWEVGREFKTETFDADGTTLLRKREMDWVQRPIGSCSPCSFSNNPFVVETREFLVDGNLVSKTSSVSPVDGSWAYDTFNNPMDVWTYEYGTGAAGPLVKHTQMSYINHTDPFAGKHLLGLPSTTSVYAVGSSGQETLASSSQVIYDEYLSYPILTYATVTGWQEPGTPRGNPTTVLQWLNTNGSWVETHAQFDQLGNSRKSWDPLGRMSQTVYADAFTDLTNRNTFAFPTQTISPIPDPGGSYGHSSTTPLVTSSVFDFHSGLTKSTTDPNGQTTQLEYNDPLNRLKKVISPNGAWAEYVYSDIIGNLYVKTRAVFDEARILESYTFFDGLGQSVRTVKLDGEGTWITADTEYDSLGRVWRASNPYHAAGLYGPVNPPGIWSTTEYDAMSRPIKSTTPDGSERITTYFSNTVTAQDPAGKTRKTVTDALGRLTQVIEIPGGLNLVTDYKYDILDNLRVVEQGGQRRYFMYDSLSRLVRSRNLEQDANANITVYDPVSDNDDWSNAIEYYANGNILSKTDARGIRTEYNYDDLNRIYKRHYVATITPPAGTYTATPDDEYFYDGKGFVTPPDFSLGKITRVYSTHSETRYTEFDQMGRLLSSEQETDGRVYPTSYSYNLSGALVSQTYPSGKVVTNFFDNVGDLWSVAGRTPTTPYKSYASGFDYDFISTGAQNKMQLGNGRWESTIFNKRLQTVQVALGTMQDATNLLKLNYNYGTSNNNTNLQSQTITVPTLGQDPGFTAVQTYSYDELNRLLTASESSDGGSG